MTSHEKLINKSRISLEQVKTSESLAIPVQVMSSLTLPPMGYRILWLPWGGASEAPEEIKEGVISDPMLLYSIFYLICLGIKCKKSTRNLKL